MPDPLLEPDPREPKLAVWAQDRLRAQRQRIADLEKSVEAVKGEHAGSNVRLVDFHARMLAPTPLPKDSQVEFDSKWGKVTVHHEMKGGRIRIQGDNTLVVRLQAGNALTVELEDS
jgi:hypothetical protein